MEILVLKIGKIIRQIRKQKGLSQTDLRKATGIESSYISRIENGQIKSPRVVTMMKIAKALGVTIEEIFRKAVAEAQFSTNPGNPNPKEDE